MVNDMRDPVRTACLLRSLLRQRSVLAGVLVLFSVTSGVAQQHYLLEETRSVAGRAQEFAAAQEDYCKAVLRGGAPQCLLLSPATFSPPDLFFTLLSFRSFRHYDEGTYTSRGETAEQAADLNRRRGPAIAENRESAISEFATVSYGALGNTPLMLVTDFTIRPGTQAALLEYIQKAEKPAALRAGLDSSQLFQIVAGADTNRYLLFQGISDFAHLDKKLPFGDMPAVGAKGPADWLLTVHRTVMRVTLDAKR